MLHVLQLIFLYWKAGGTTLILQ